MASYPRVSQIGIPDGRSETDDDETPERDKKTSMEPSVSLTPAHITISDEEYRLYSQHPKITGVTGTGDERRVKATGPRAIPGTCRERVRMW